MRQAKYQLSAGWKKAGSYWINTLSYNNILRKRLDY